MIGLDVGILCYTCGCDGKNLNFCVKICVWVLGVGVCVGAWKCLFFLGCVIAVEILWAGCGKFCGGFVESLWCGLQLRVLLLRKCCVRGVRIRGCWRVI
jgi:hypothetical protein